MFMALNSLVEVYTKPRTEIEKKITNFLNYSAIHPEAITEYRISVIILRVYLDESYI